MTNQEIEIFKILLIKYQQFLNAGLKTSVEQEALNQRRRLKVVTKIKGSCAI